MHVDCGDEWLPENKKIIKRTNECDPRMRLKGKREVRNVWAMMPEGAGDGK
jgi:hypothetical protein